MVMVIVILHLYHFNSYSKVYASAYTHSLTKSNSNSVTNTIANLGSDFNVTVLQTAALKPKSTSTPNQ